MTRAQVAASVAKRKAEHPERYCPQKNCLWRTDGSYCPRHAPKADKAAGDLPDFEDLEVRRRFIASLVNGLGGLA